MGSEMVGDCSTRCSNFIIYYIDTICQRSMQQIDLAVLNAITINRLFGGFYFVERISHLILKLNLTKCGIYSIWAKHVCNWGQFTKTRDDNWKIF